MFETTGRPDADDLQGMKEKVAETTGGDTGCETTSAMKAATNWQINWNKTYFAAEYF